MIKIGLKIILRTETRHHLRTGLVPEVQRLFLGSNGIQFSSPKLFIRHIIWSIRWVIALDTKADTIIADRLSLITFKCLILQIQHPFLDLAIMCFASMFLGNRLASRNYYSWVVFDQPSFFSSAFLILEEGGWKFRSKELTRGQRDGGVR